MLPTSPSCAGPGSQNTEKWGASTHPKAMGTYCKPLDFEGKRGPSFSENAKTKHNHEDEHNINIMLEKGPLLQGVVWRYENGCGSKNRYQNGTLVNGNMNQNPRNPSCSILSHTQMKRLIQQVEKEVPSGSKRAPWNHHERKAVNSTRLLIRFRLQSPNLLILARNKKFQVGLVGGCGSVPFFLLF